MKLLTKLKQIVTLLAIALLCLSCSQVPSTGENPWRVLRLPTEAAFSDIAFTEDGQHGWLVGSRAALLETFDGGDTWQERPLELGEEKVTFTGVAFAGQEGWIVGKPSILLHTDDGGAQWTRIALSDKLPGAPYDIVALGRQSAEMVTDLGAIYKTADGGLTWKALVEGAVGVARTISRGQDGRYVAVSARGNFYSTWEPGQTEWTPHQRTSSRRLQTMGFGKDGNLWLLARGGQIQFSDSLAEDSWDEVIYPELSASWGLLDLAYRTPEEIWVAGGSGNLLISRDGGKTWEKDRAVESVASNFYKIVFLGTQKGFILGQRGTILKYEPDSAAA
ncbi:MAG: photosynthesis system II assembly factor Ycf48 [Chloroflexaceae bacterium]|nr:photosynthesis system II assembly factor Ycf48 [Chloroflexaceae bacterium]